MGSRVLNMPGLRFLITLAIFSSIYFGMNHFIYSRLSSGLFPDGRGAIPLRIFLFLGSMTFFAGMFYRVWPPLFNLLRVGNVWLGFSAIALSVLLVKYPLDLAYPAQIKNGSSGYRVGKNKG